MSANTRLFHPPAPAGADEYERNGLSSTSLAPVDVTTKLMAEDKILEQAFYTSLSGKPKRDIYKCILFVYGFMVERRSWVRVERSVEGYMEIMELAKANAEDRIALVQELTNNQDCLVRLLQIATGQGDDDLMKSADTVPLIENYLRSLFRFFSMEKSFGFKQKMEDVIWSLCDQTCENCFLITACEFVDLQMQKDLQLTDKEKLQCFDKSQVARRTMSATDLASYVVKNSGNSGLEVIEKLLGGSDETDLLQKFVHEDSCVFETAEDIDDVFVKWRKKGGRIGYVTFDATGFKAADNEGVCKIPCFDVFGQLPAKWLTLETAVPGENEWLKKQVPPRQLRAIHAPPTSLFQTSPSSDAVEEKDSKENWEHIDKTASIGDADGSGLPASAVRHSVTAIGGYTDEDEKTWYCMKNSWKKMPLFLASSNWLAAAAANCATVRSPIKTIPTGYQRTENRFSSCASPLVNEEGNWKARCSGLDDGFWSGP